MFFSKPSRIAELPDDAKANGRTDVRPLGASLNETHVFVFFFAFDFFVPISYSFEQPLHTE
jgi:hypothetical protein